MDLSNLTSLISSPMGQKALQIILKQVGVSQPQLLGLLNLGQGGSMMGSNAIGPNNMGNAIGPNNMGNAIGPNNMGNAIGPNNMGNAIGPNNMMGNNMMGNAIGPNNMGNAIGPNNMGHAIGPNNMGNAIGPNNMMGNNMMGNAIGPNNMGNAIGPNNMGNCIGPNNMGNAIGPNNMGNCIGPNNMGMGMQNNGMGMQGGMGMQNNGMGMYNNGMGMQAGGMGMQGTMGLPNQLQGMGNISNGGYAGLLLVGLRQVAPQLFSPSVNIDPMAYTNTLPVIMQLVPQLNSFPQSTLQSGLTQMLQNWNITRQLISMDPSNMLLGLGVTAGLRNLSNESMFNTPSLPPAPPAPAYDHTPKILPPGYSLDTAPPSSIASPSMAPPIGYPSSPYGYSSYPQYPYM